MANSSGDLVERSAGHGRAQWGGLGRNRGCRRPAGLPARDFGKFRYEQAKKEKESKKHQHATTVKEVQLSPAQFDPHDLGVQDRARR